MTSPCWPSPTSNRPATESFTHLIAPPAQPAIRRPTPIPLFSETIHRSLATITPSWEGAGGWVMEGARLGTKKSENRKILTFFCARNRTRTCTALRPLVPETSVSTNFTIRADTSFFQRDCKDSAFFVYRKLFFEAGLKIKHTGQAGGDADDSSDIADSTYADA